MIGDRVSLARVPLRLSLAGGGTDLPFYAERFGADLLTATISLFVTVIARSGRVDGRSRFSHERTWHADADRSMTDRYVAAATTLCGTAGPYEIASLGPVPAGTGLGSSGAFSVALLAALHLNAGRTVAPVDLAEQAYVLEAERLSHPTGRQDHYACALGGVRRLRVDTDGRARSTPASADEATLRTLDDHLHLFYTGVRRQSAAHSAVDRENLPRRIESLHLIKDIGIRARQALAGGDIDGFADLMNEHWAVKARTADPVWSSHLADACTAGARAGKIVGAGGGGFLLVFAEPRRAPDVATAMRSRGLTPVAFSFTASGVEAGVWPPTPVDPVPTFEGRA